MFFFSKINEVWLQFLKREFLKRKIGHRVSSHFNFYICRPRGAPSKPPRHKKERSQSFTPNSNINETTEGHKTASHVSRVDVKSSSDTSLDSNSSADKMHTAEDQHIYEEIKNSHQRPLPPIPPTPKVSTTSTIVSVSSKLSSLKAQIDEEDVKSIFVGATKYEILNYLEDAKERGVDNINDPLNEAENESTVGQLAERGHANRVSQFSQNRYFLLPPLLT